MGVIDRFNTTDALKHGRGGGETDEANLQNATQSGRELRKMGRSLQDHSGQGGL